MSQRPLFHDRTDAGRRLATKLERFAPERPLVLGLPRGGVPVAAEVAKRLGAPLDLLVVRKIGMPGHAEFALGAIAPGVEFLDRSLIGLLRVPAHAIERVVAAERQELARREATYRQGGRRPAPDVGGRTVIIVDDGLATGASALAAIESLRRSGAARIVFAAPVCAPESVGRLRGVADEVVCIEAPDDFQAVGLWYVDFSPTSDAEVLELLGGLWAGEGGEGAGPGP